MCRLHNTRKYSYLVVILFMILLLAACESGTSKNGESIDSDSLPITEDMELSAVQLEIWWDDGFGVPHEPFARDLLNSNFKNTRFVYQTFQPPAYYIGTELFDLIQSKAAPDLIVFDARYLPILLEIDYLEPLPEMFSLEIDYDVATEMRSLAADRELYALPYGYNVSGLFYNKGIFDQLNLPYPTDEMTWEDVLKLVTNIRGHDIEPLDISEIDLIASQLSLALYDPETEKVNFETNEWSELLQLLLDYREQNQKEKNLNMKSFGVGDTAMAIGSAFGDFTRGQGLNHQESSLNLFKVDWDIVSFPLLNGNLPARHTLVIGIPSKSENKEDSLKVLRYLLSKEVQTYNNRNGLASLRGDADTFIGEFGTTSSLLSGKSVFSFFTNAPRGKFDISFEYFELDLKMAGIMWNDETVYDINTGIERSENAIKESLLKYFEKRKAFIEEMRSRF